MQRRDMLLSIVCASTLALGCGDDSQQAASDGSESGDASGSESGEPAESAETGTDSDVGDGDGDPAGDGDGDASGDGDGDVGDGDGDGSGDGDGDVGDGDGDVAGECGDGIVDDGEVCDDGVNDGSYGGCEPDCLSLAERCGDGVINGPEECDDENMDSSDGCLGSCLVPRSCAEILAFDDAAADGAYLVAVYYPEPAFAVQCDMSTDGGGWTGFVVANLCEDLEVDIVEFLPASQSGEDEACRPFTLHTGSHTHAMDISFPPGFEAFYLSGYAIKANSPPPSLSDINGDAFVQEQWGFAHTQEGPGWSDVSFGAAELEGPETSYGTEGASFQCSSCEEPFPASDQIFSVEPSTAFRIGWGDRGIEPEGWFPWYDGAIYLR